MNGTSTYLAMLADFHFLRPVWLLLIPVGAMLLWLLRRPGGSMRAWSQVCDEHLLRYLQVGQGAGGQRLVLSLLAAAWLIASLALAGPVWQRVPQTLLQDMQARIIVFDLSRSMLATDLAPSRLARARFKIEDLLKKTPEGQTGLIAYAADAFVVSPLTKDAKTISNLMRAMDPSIMPTQGSSLAEGLALASQLLVRAGASNGQILVVADSAEPAAIDLAAQLADQGIATSVLGVGTGQGGSIELRDGQLLKDRVGTTVVARLEADALRELADAGEGRYATITSDGRDLDYLSQAPLTLGSPGETADEQSELWLDRGPWLVVLLLPIAALAFRRGWLVVCGVLMLVPPDAAQASWRDWFRNQEQRAESAMQQDDYEQALALSTNPLRQGNAAFRQGDYAAAERFYSADPSADGHYNQGNALAAQQRYPEAIDAYDRALALQADHEDAAYNKALLEQRQQQQQEQQEQQDQNSEQEQEQEQDQQQPQGDEDQQSEEQPGDEQEQQQQPDPADEEPMNDEEQQAVEQWLRRVPDDPGGLLRRKFRLQHQQRGSPPADTDEEW